MTRQSVGRFPALTSRRRVLGTGAALVTGLLLVPPVPVFAEDVTTPQGSTPETALPLGDSVKGVLQGTTGGAFAYYQRTPVDSSPQRITLSYQPFDAPQGHRIGFAVYQGSVRLGGGTGTDTGLGDPVTSNEPSVIVTPHAGGGPVLVQVFVYSPQIVIYTLSMTSPAAPSGTPTSGPSELQGTTGGVLPSNSGGAFATYMISRPTGKPLTVNLVYGPFDAGYAHAVGLSVYQGGRSLGTATSLATGLGDSINRNAAQLTVTPAADAGVVTIRIYSYSGFNINYTLLAS
jgi:hypothetical protein